MHFAAAKPGLEARFDQFGDGRAWHQRARIALEAEPGEPGLASEVTGGNALVDPALEQGQYLRLLVGNQACMSVGGAGVVRQVQGVQHQLRGFIQRIVEAVAEAQPGGAEAARAVADEVDDGVEFGAHAGPLPAKALSIAAARL